MVSLKRYYALAVSLLALMSAGAGAASAQNAYDALRYNLTNPGNDPVNLVLPSVANAGGMGTWVDNPAALALFDKSYASIGLGYRDVSEDVRYIGTTDNINDTQTALSDLGLAYRVPTDRGSLVLGASYNQVYDFNRALSVNARNDQSTITDMFNQSDFYYDTAFNVYALDWADIDSTYTSSIFRIGFPPNSFPGIDQQAEVTERGQLGEFGMFMATEFQKNLMVGVSINIPTGNYSYKRVFLETDSQNDYNGNFIDSDGDGQGDTDIRNMLSEDRIDATLSGFSARVGFLYKVLPVFQVGASYRLPFNLHVDEDYTTDISTTMDNGATFNDGFDGKVSYKVYNPARLNLGAAIVNAGGLTISGSAEYIDYSKVELKDLDFQVETTENNFARDEFQQVWNLRVGAEFALTDVVRPRIGYAYYPSPRKNFDAARTYYNGGISIGVADQMTLEVGAQYATWKDKLSMYDYTPEGASSTVSEMAYEDVSRLHVMASLTWRF